MRYDRWCYKNNQLYEVYKLYGIGNKDNKSDPILIVIEYRKVTAIKRFWILFKEFIFGYNVNYASVSWKDIKDNKSWGRIFPKKINVYQNEKA